jgi:hypothetical protein
MSLASHIAKPASQRLSLPQVTLVAVDTRAPAIAAQALARSMAQVDFARVVLFTHGWHDAPLLPGIDVVDCGVIQSGHDYSAFVLRHMPAHIHTSHVLVTQWDGFVVDASAWSDEFLAFDYIGAVWPDQAEPNNVGNGGFSLRSRRLMQAGTDARITQLHPEDLVLCRTYRELLMAEHGVRFAPASLARRFAFENETPKQPTFGFHGPYNLPRVMEEAALARCLDALPPEFFRSRDARRMARALLVQRMPRLAQALLHKRLSAGRTDINTRVLGALAAAQSMFTKAAP